ncbi:MAG: hypothetical protein N3A58_00030 [Spirochaetes bacterium]|nr:hypothetical protein [Spirochaetota bacterium]
MDIKIKSEEGESVKYEATTDIIKRTIEQSRLINNLDCLRVQLPYVKLIEKQIFNNSSKINLDSYNWYFEIKKDRNRLRYIIYVKIKINKQQRKNLVKVNSILNFRIYLNYIRIELYINTIKENKIKKLLELFEKELNKFLFIYLY